MGLNITFWNCQGVRSKRKELELYLNENSIDIIALNETFLTKKVNFKIPGYDTIRNDCSTGQKGGVAFLVKHGLVVNKEFRNADFNIITDNEALAINLELSCNQNLTLATIYCPHGKPNLSLFQTICNLSDNVMFVGDFNSKSEAFGCASKNDSGPMLKIIQNTLDLIYLNNTEHTYMDWRNSNTDILDMAFITQNLIIHDTQFQIGVDLGSDHLPIEITIDTTPHRNTFTDPTRYKFDQTDREVFQSILEEALGSEDFSGHLSTNDLDRYTDFIVTALHTAVDKAIPKSKSVQPESNPISNVTLVLVKEKRKLRWQYSQMKDPAVKTRINQLQKQVKDDLGVESQASWEKFCKSISLETDSNESWRKIKNFLKPKGQRDYPTLHHATKVAKTNADKAQLFAESVERHFGIESEHFDSNHFNEVNKFVEDKIFQLGLPTKMTCWLSDFLVGRLIQVNVNSFLSNQINPKAEVPQGSVLSPLLFLIYVNDLPLPHHKQNSLSQFADDTAQWAFKPAFLSWRKTLADNFYNRNSQGDYLLQVPARQESRTQPNTIWRASENLSSSEILRHYFRFKTHFPKTL